MSRKEKKFLIFFIILCVLLPFVAVRDPIEIVSLVFPLWINYYGVVALWSYWGKPLWQALLACYGISSLGIIGFYFGTSVVQTIISWFKKKFGIIKKERGKLTKKTINHKGRFAKWLGKGSVWLILFVLFIPFPWSDPIATMAMKIKGTKYGLWYLLLVNIFHIYLIVFGIYSGVKIFFF